MNDHNQFKDLNLDREQLVDCLNQFCQEKQAHLELIEDTSSKKVYKIIKPGIEPARLVFHFRNTGTTTIQISEGRNKELNYEVAEYIKIKLCQTEISSLNMSILGINNDFISIVLEEIESIKEKNRITIETQKISGGVLYILKSLTYKDQLNLSFYEKANKLLIQGRPLSCYKVVVYALSIIIDIDTLAKILYKKDEFDKIIVRTEVAEDILKTKLPKSYDKLPTMIKNILISSCCIKAASPNLPEYSMLTYCELRALEGIIKAKFLEYGITDIPSNVGALFNCSSNPITLNPIILQKNSRLVNIQSSLEQAYIYYRQRRHALFHMESFTDATAKISSLQEALQIGNKVYTLIENFY